MESRPYEVLPIQRPVREAAVQGLNGDILMGKMTQSQRIG